MVFCDTTNIRPVSVEPDKRVSLSGEVCSITMFLNPASVSEVVASFSDSVKTQNFSDKVESRCKSKYFSP